jgi:hypothetical protein
MKMELTEGSETSACKIQTPGNHPKEIIPMTIFSMDIKMFYSKFFSDALSKLRKATFSFVMSVRLFVRPFSTEQLGSHWTDFYEIIYLSTCGEPVLKIQVSLISDKNNGYFP